MRSSSNRNPPPVAALDVTLLNGTPSTGTATSPLSVLSLADEEEEGVDEGEGEGPSRASPGRVRAQSA